MVLLLDRVDLVLGVTIQVVLRFKVLKVLIVVGRFLVLLLVIVVRMEYSLLSCGIMGKSL